MDNFAAEYHAQTAYFKVRFPQPEYDLAVSILRSVIRDMDALHYLDTLLEGRGIGFEVEDIAFPNEDDEAQQWGVKFACDLTWADPDNYRECIVPYDVFLDMLRAGAQWHLRTSAADEDRLLHYFRERNLALRLDGSDYPHQDDGETWWRKCDDKRILCRSLRGTAHIVAGSAWQGIEDFFAHLPEHLMLDFLRSAAQRQNYETFFGRRLEDLVDRNATFFLGTLLDFSPIDEVHFVYVEHNQLEAPKPSHQTVVTRQSFEAMLEAVAKAYANRRPQHAAKVLKLMRIRIS